MCTRRVNIITVDGYVIHAGQWLEQLWCSTSGQDGGAVPGSQGPGPERWQPHGWSPAPAVFDSSRGATLCTGCRATPGLSHMISHNTGTAPWQDGSVACQGAVYSGGFFGSHAGVGGEARISAARGFPSPWLVATGAQPCQATWAMVVQGLAQPVSSYLFKAGNKREVPGLCLFFTCVFTEACLAFLMV